MRDWGKRLKFMLAERKLSQRQLAARMDVSPQSVTKWVKGGRISDDRLGQLARLLRVNEVWLMYGDEGVAQAALAAIKSEKVRPLVLNVICNYCPRRKR